ncbi:MAG: NAD-dependent epimerase/dehydratase family protein [Acidimicrobiales bacterium]
MRVLITGGAGFIGGNLSHELARLGHSVTALDDLSNGRRRNLEGSGADLIVGSILDVDTLTTVAAEADAIVHLAARSSVPRSLDDPIASHMANASGTLNVLDAARRVGGRQVIIASSSSVYGANAELPKRETAATRPMSPYAASKLAAEAYALAYGTSFGLPTLAFRFFNVFGPLQAAGHAYAAVIPAFADAALRGAPITVHGDGTQSRDFTHVTTVCRTISAALERGVSNPDPVNLAFGSRITLNEVLDMISAQVDAPLVIHNTENRVGDVPHSQADPTQLRSLFPDVAPIDFEIGLTATVDWMRTEIARGTIDLVHGLTPYEERAAA